jgi:hypothetical protein
LRLINIGCRVTYGKGEVKVPVEVKDYEDFVPGTRYPKMHERKVWFVEVVVPVDLMDDIKEGTIDLADQTIDLSEIDDAYNEDLDNIEQTEAQQGADAGMGEMPAAGGMAPGAPM